MFVEFCLLQLALELLKVEFVGVVGEGLFWLTDSAEREKECFGDEVYQADEFIEDIVGVWF